MPEITNARMYLSICLSIKKNKQMCDMTFQTIPWWLSFLECRLTHLTACLRSPRNRQRNERWGKSCSETGHWSKWLKKKKKKVSQDGFYSASVTWNWVGSSENDWDWCLLRLSRDSCGACWWDCVKIKVFFPFPPTLMSAFIQMLRKAIEWKLECKKIQASLWKKKKNDLALQISHFPKCLNLSRVSMWERDNGKHSVERSQKLQVDQANHVSDQSDLSSAQR